MNAVFAKTGHGAVDAIKLSGLTKSYGKARGIKGLGLCVAQGEFFGFIGPNGAGKSTTIRTLLGLLKPDAGTAEIFGKDVRTRREEILEEVGYLPSEALFYPGMRVREVIAFSAKLRGKDCAQEAEKLCARLGLDTAKKVRELSFGNRRKLGIVCALQHMPRLCILDEPTSGLDPLMQREFFEILKERNAAGATVFLSSHILSEVQQYCSRAAVIREGSIIVCESVKALAKTSAKRVHIRGNVDVSGLVDVRDLRQEGREVSFLYGGEIGALLTALCGQEIEDLAVAEPDLEEIFMHYYQEGAYAEH